VAGAERDERLMPGRVSPWKAGLAGRCPRCGEGPLFAGFLRVADHCEACGLDMRGLEAADGPAFFAMSAVGIVVAFAALFFEVAFKPPIWVHMILWFPLAIVLCLALLRPIKGVIVAQQHRSRAAEVRNDDF
jgi:uncharacterized protein (DUF983 family)